MTITKEAVTKAFIRYLGRAPESEATLETHMALPDENHLTRTLTKSNEYLNRILKTHPSAQSIDTRVLLIGNCQLTSIAYLINSMAPNTHAAAIELIPSTAHAIMNGYHDLEKLIDKSDIVVLQHLPSEPLYRFLTAAYPAIQDKIRLCPAISFTAFHPDMGYVKDAAANHITGPMGEYHSMIAFWSWKNGLSEEQAEKLFNARVYKHLGYFDHLSSSKEFLSTRGQQTNFHLDTMVDKWLASGCFMHSINHPKISVLADIARGLLKRDRIDFLPNIEDYLDDHLALHPCWPVYPEIANRFSIEGHYNFKQTSSEANRSAVSMIGLKDFIARSYKQYTQYSTELLSSFRMEATPFKTLQHFLSAVSETAPTAINPYRKLPDFHFWKRSVESPAISDVDPVVHTGMHLKASDKVATAGSCFAQHISRTLSNNGFSYYVAETHDVHLLSEEEAASKNYGVFSARYGNVYTAKQLTQLFSRAYGTFQPQDSYWALGDGNFADPFRPQIEAGGFKSVHDLISSRDVHLEKVRELFENMNIFVFTLGLTECWRSLSDGAVFPIAPGVISKHINPADYEFVNFETHEIISDLQAFICQLKSINPTCRIILTVSPVPLVATYEDQHVLTATTYSKSALRAAADYIVRRHAHCEYFPSYEIITGNYNRGAYYESDLRSVKPEGVAHVMRLFMEHYSKESTPKVETAASDTSLLEEAKKVNAIVCEEELLDSR